jgi:hypothetical protein
MIICFVTSPVLWDLLWQGLDMGAASLIGGRSPPISEAAPISTYFTVITNDPQALKQSIMLACLYRYLSGNSATSRFFIDAKYDGELCD